MCFLFAVGAFMISYLAISLTREEETPPVASGIEQKDFWKDLRSILRRDANFRWFVVVRILAQIGYGWVCILYGLRGSILWGG